MWANRADVVADVGVGVDRYSTHQTIPGGYLLFVESYLNPVGNRGLTSDRTPLFLDRPYYPPNHSQT